MLYAAQALPPTAQLSAFECRLFSPSDPTLVVNKLDRIECYAVQASTNDETALQLVLSVPVAGQIAAIESVHPPHSSRASLIVLTTSLRLFVLAAPTAETGATKSPSLETVSSISIEEPFARLADYQAILVDPLHRCIAVHAYAGLVRVVSLIKSERATASGSNNMMEEDDDNDEEGEGEDKADRRKAPKRIRSARTGPIDLSHNFTLRLSSLLNVAGLAFIDSSTTAASSSSSSSKDPINRDPVLACINTDHTGTRILTSLEIDLDDKDLRQGPLEPQTLADQGSEVLIPFGAVSSSPNALRGLLVVGESSITYFPALEPSTTSSASASAAGPSPSAPGKGKRRASSSASLTAQPVKAGGRNGSRPMPVSRITAWAQLSADQYLIGDIYGKLLLLTVQHKAGQEVDLTIRDLGDATSPTSIVAIRDSSPSANVDAPTDLVYLSSRFGDSQLVRLDGLASGGAVELQLVASYSSLAPITDCCLIQDETGGASSLVTCSGAYKTGSLRVVKRGVGLNEMAALEVPGVQKLWSFPAADGSYLLVLGSFADTRVLRVTFPAIASNDDSTGEETEVDVDEVSIAPFSDPTAASATTLFAGRVGSLFVQARADGVAYSSEGGEGVQVWTAQGGKKVTAATGAGSDGLLVAVEGGRLELIQAQGNTLTSTASTQFPNDIASLAVSHTGDKAMAAVGLWTSQEVRLVELPSLETRATQVIDSTYLICSLALGLPSASTEDRSRSGLSLLVGLGDGTLTTYEIEAESYSVRSKSARSTVLGRKPLSLTSLGGAEGGILALSERPTAVTKARGRLTYSSVNLTGVTAVTSLVDPTNAAARPVLAVATAEGVSLGQLDAIQQIDVKTVPLDEDEPRRIAYDGKRQLMGVVCSRRDVDRQNGVQSIASIVRLVKQEAFSTGGTFTLPEGEEAQSIACVDSGEASFFVVGATKLDPNAAEPSEGRLLVLQENADGEVLTASETPVAGCPYAVISLGEGLVATAINSQVAVWSLSTEGELVLSATWSGAFIAYTLARGPTPSTLIVGDALRSVTLLEYVPPPSAPMQAKLKELGKDYRARYMVAVEALSPFEQDGSTSAASPSSGEGTNGTQRIIGAEADLNVFTLERDPQAGARNMADAGTLAAQAQWHAGEVISRFRRGALSQQHESAGSASTSTSTLVQPQLVYTTSAGAIGVIAEVDSKSGRILSALERNLRTVIDQVGGLDHEASRAYKVDKTTTPAAGFVDGSFVERFLDLDEEEQERVVQGRSEPEKLELSREEVIALLEEMARVH